MENDQALEAEADLGAYERTDARTRRRSSEGHDVMKVALGSFEPEHERNTEHTPLLRRNNNYNERTAEDIEGDNAREREAPAWDGERDFEGLPWYKTPSIYWLLPPFVLFTTAFGGTVVPRLNLVLSLICREYFCERSIQDPTFHMMPVMLGSDNPQCQIPEVQALVSKFTLYQSLLSGIISAVTSPKLGELSDRYGRKRLICISALGLLINEIISICVYTYPDMLSVKWILLGSVFDGLGGSFIAAMALSYAFASDCIIPERRNVVFGWYQGSLFGGFALGPILAGYVVKATGKLLSVFYIAIALHGAFFLFILLIVPESLSKERQMAAREKRRVKDKDSVGDFREHSSSNWLTYLIRIIKSSNLVAPLAILWPTEPGTNPDVRRNLALLAAVDGTMFGIAMGSLTVILLYSEYMFGWNTFESSVFVSIVNVCRVTTLLVLLPIITRIVRGPASRRTKQTSGSDKIDLRIIRTAITFDLLGYIGYASFRTGPLFIMCGAIAAVGGMGSPILQASLTKHVPSDRTGQVLGAMGLLHAAGRVVSPIIFNLIYASTVGKFTQTVFVCLAATFGLAFLFSWFIKPNVYWDAPYKAPHSNVTIDDTDRAVDGEGSETVR